MQLRYTDNSGRRVMVHLGSNTIVAGRSPRTDLVLAADNVSRAHFSIREWDGEYVLKDLNSENGTLVNGKRIDVAVLQPGDKIEAGSCTIHVEEKAPKPPNTIIREIGKQMTSEGKGYKTLLFELSKEAEEDKPTRQDPRE